MNRVFLPVMALILVVGGALMFVRSSGGIIVQPISFNHKKHAENGLECAACHESFSNSAWAGRPKTETCMMCHETAMTQSPEEEKVRQYAAQGKEIPWSRLYRVPDHVYFSHQTHIVSAKIECKACHGRIGESISPPAKPDINLTMDDCIACHTMRQASTDCNACHR
jgi:hypothetical protein